VTLPGFSVKRVILVAGLLRKILSLRFYPILSGHLKVVI